MLKIKKLGGPTRWKPNSACLTKTGFLIITITLILALFITRSLTYSVVSAAGCCICMDLIIPAVMCVLRWQNLDAGIALSVVEHIIVSLLFRLLFAALQALVGVVIFIPLLMYLLLQLLIVAICTVVRLCANIGSVASTKSWEIMQPLCLWGQQILLLKTLEECVQGEEVIFPLPNKLLAVSAMIIMLWSKFERKFPHLSTSDKKIFRIFAKYGLHPMHNIFLLILAFPSNMHVLYMAVALPYLFFTEGFFQDWIIAFLEEHCHLLLKYTYYFFPFISRGVWSILENLPGFEEQYIHVCYEIATACTAAAIIAVSTYLQNYESIIVLAVVFLTNVAIPMGSAKAMIKQLQREIAQIDRFKKATPLQLSRVQDVCSICWLPFEVAVVTKCGHFFHGKCLKQWVIIKETCPLCNRDINV